jgi:hypothetical protein
MLPGQKYRFSQNRAAMQNPESLSNTKEPLTSGFASGFPEMLSGKR